MNKNQHPYMKTLKNKIMPEQAKNKLLPEYKEKRLCFLVGKEIEYGKKSIWLSNPLGGNADYRLWNVENTNEEEVSVSPYKGADYDALILELMDLFLETAFDK